MHLTAMRLLIVTMIGTLLISGTTLCAETPVAEAPVTKAPVTKTPVAEAHGGEARTREAKVVGPRDLQLSYVSDVDGTTQPYRVFLPSSYDGTTPLPMLVALHGTGGSQDTYATTYHDGIYVREADKRGIVLVCPHGRGTTEYRGIGENDVLTVIEKVCQDFAIDRDRIVCSGQSMGGTGTTYLCCRYPDLFAAGIPLASTYGHLSLVANLMHVPMLYVQGEKDWPVYAKNGPIPITRRLKELGYNGRLWMVPGAKHNTMDITTAEVLDWALAQKRVTHPRRVLFRAYLPFQGRAYWTEIVEIREPGLYAEIDATIQGDNTIVVSLKNANRVTLRPDPELLDLAKPIQVVVDGKSSFTGSCAADQQIQLAWDGAQWRGSVAERQLTPYTAYRTHVIGVVAEPPSQPLRWDTSGANQVAVRQSRTFPAETTMGSWMADAMRSATGADVAVYNRRYYRGVPLEKDQQLFAVDLFNWLRPTNSNLGTFEVTGKDLLEIIEDNIRDAEGEDEFLLQVSGCRYAFDRNRAKGERIVSSDIDSERRYTVVCETHMLARGDTCFLAGHTEKLQYTDTDISNVSAAWRYIVAKDGVVEGMRDGRVRDLTGKR